MTLCGHFTHVGYFQAEEEAISALVADRKNVEDMRRALEEEVDKMRILEEKFVVSFLLQVL